MIIVNNLPQKQPHYQTSRSDASQPPDEDGGLAPRLFPETHAYVEWLVNNNAYFWRARDLFCSSSSRGLSSGTSEPSTLAFRLPIRLYATNGASKRVGSQNVHRTVESGCFGGVLRRNGNVAGQIVLLEELGHLRVSSHLHRTDFLRRPVIKFQRVHKTNMNLEVK